MLERESSLLCGLHDDFTIGYLNSAWTRFADENGASDLHVQYGLGSNWWRCVPAVLEPFLRDAFARARAEPGVWEHSYSCPSAEFERQWRMRILVLPRGGYLLDYQLLSSHLHDEPVCGLDARDYLDEREMFVQCAHCRRMKRAKPPERWDWMPQHVTSPQAATTHSLCELCLAVFYPEPR